MAGRIENLKPWKPGQSGNPRGRALVRDRAEEQLERLLHQDSGDGTPVSEAIVGRLLRDAKAGKPYALKLALDRILPAIEIREVSSDASGSSLDALLDSFVAGKTNGAAGPARVNGTNGSGEGQE